MRGTLAVGEHFVSVHHWVEWCSALAAVEASGAHVGPSYDFPVDAAHCADVGERMWMRTHDRKVPLHRTWPSP